MAHAHAPTLDPQRLQIGSISGRLGIPGLVVGVVALAIAMWKGFQPVEGSDPQIGTDHFFHSYLTAYSFFMAITLGALAFVLIQHLARAGWSVTVRRLAEGVALNVFLMIVLIIPFFIPVEGENGVHRLFHWMHHGVTDYDTILKSKESYLNPQAFALRMFGYFAIWAFLAWFYASKSAQQDAVGGTKISLTLERMAAPGIILFGFSLTCFAVDWVMSLNPHWFSTIFGVYFFAGAMLSAFSTIVLLSLVLKKRGLIGNAIGHEHYHDLGKWMFAFTFFWGYIAFSQYMLIWYANIPEETQFYIPRQVGHWGAISLTLLIVHLVIPFPGLISRHVKRKNAVIAFWAVWSLCACALDQFWLVMPNLWVNRIPEIAGNHMETLPAALPKVIESTHNIYALKQGTPALNELNEAMNYSFHGSNLVVTVLCFVGIGGLYLFSTMFALRNKSLVPLKDPRLPEALAFENI